MKKPSPPRRGSTVLRPGRQPSKVLCLIRLLRLERSSPPPSWQTACTYAGILAVAPGQVALGLSSARPDPNPLEQSRILLDDAHFLTSHSAPKLSQCMLQIVLVSSSEGIQEWVADNREIILCSRAVTSLVQMHLPQLSTSQKMQQTLKSLDENIQKHLCNVRLSRPSLSVASIVNCHISWKICSTLISPHWNT